MSLVRNIRIVYTSWYCYLCKGYSLFSLLYFNEFSKDYLVTTRYRPRWNSYNERHHAFLHVIYTLHTVVLGCSLYVCACCCSHFGRLCLMLLNAFWYLPYNILLLSLRLRLTLLHLVLCMSVLMFLQVCWCLNITFLYLLAFYDFTSLYNFEVFSLMHPFNINVLILHLE